MSAAFSIDGAATPALPPADNGRITATLTLPLPTATACTGAPAGPGGGGGDDELNGLGTENWLMLCWMLAHAPSSGAPRMSPSAVRRLARAPEIPGFPVPDLSVPDLSDWKLGANAPTIMSLFLSGLVKGRTSPRLRHQEWCIRAYCRRIVNQNKRIWAFQPWG